MMGYCLSIQSLWEKQIRAYLQSAAKELAPRAQLVEKVQKANWDGLNGPGEVKANPAESCRYYTAGD